MSTLSEYLRERKLTLDPVQVELDTISPEDKNVISGIDPNALQLLVQNRINSIGKELLLNATPEEVIVLREAMSEVAELITDHFKIQQEVKRTTIEQTPEQTQPSPPVEVGEEGSL